MIIQGLSSLVRDIIARVGPSTLAAAAVLFAGAAHAQTADAVGRNKASIERSFAAWAADTGSPYDLLKDDVRWEIVGRSAASKAYPSREAFLSEVIRPFNARMKQSLTPAIRAMYGEGDTVVILFDASGVARDGQPNSNTYS
jgi:uncharacterized protein